MHAQAKDRSGTNHARTAPGDRLTRAEAEILGLISRGLSTREVALKLSVSSGTVRCHLHHVFQKLEARNRLEALAKAGSQIGSHA